ncbi:Hypothetical protein CINCED_3A004350 [Cinara cedri]|uniref:Uncharacterized protein n=1 Tax=Cinara cedri TaxID=506608 RepID=A0A5E4N546_9HEMI|nr:Hypothetical protein CINCED_3A004350 [Cinara cedri]
MEILSEVKTRRRACAKWIKTENTLRSTENNTLVENSQLNTSRLINSTACFADR